MEAKEDGCDWIYQRGEWIKADLGLGDDDLTEALRSSGFLPQSVGTHERTDVLQIWAQAPGQARSVDCYAVVVVELAGFAETIAAPELPDLVMLLKDLQPSIDILSRVEPVLV